jgi:hypothetical protein
MFTKAMPLASVNITSSGLIRWTLIYQPRGSDVHRSHAIGFGEHHFLRVDKSMALVNITSSGLINQCPSYEKSLIA